MSKPGRETRGQLKRGLILSAAMASLIVSLGPAPAGAQSAGSQAAGRDLNLPQDSAFRNPDIIYLEADEVVDDQTTGVLTAKGNVDAKYEDRTLRADSVIYNTKTGRVIATGNVVLIDGQGNAQYSDRIELSDELQSGVARDFTARFPEGGIAGAAFAVRRSDEGIDLYNAYYTACEPCNEPGAEARKPTWRIRARKVTQDKEDKMIHYRDAVMELLGVPIFYTPYIAHPDPSTERRSGWMMPFGGRSGAYGVFYEQPYYFALSDYSELLVTPRIMERVNPLLGATYRKQFHSGRLELDGSLTYGEFFDNNGDPFSDADVFLNPEESLRGEKLRSHIFARGHFDLTDKLSWGFGLQNVSDDLYLDRYDIDEPDDRFGLYDAGSRRLTQQIYGVAQGEDYRYSASTFGYQSLRTQVSRSDNNFNNIIVSRENDSALPVVLPKIQIDHYMTEPVLRGRVRAFGDVTVLERSIGDDYARVSAGAEWSKTMIAPGGIEVKPFANARYDKFTLESSEIEDRDFNRTTGQLGIDARWTFVRPGDNGVNLTLEPRVQVTQNFGDGKNDQFFYMDGADTVSLLQDSLSIDLDQTLLWSSNKSTGYDLWQEGLRADVGGAIGADWGDNRAELFLGQSYIRDFEEVFTDASGLSGDRSDLVSTLDLDLGGKFTSKTRIRYDDDAGTLRRIDQQMRYSGERLSGSLRYYRIDEGDNAVVNTLEDTAPPEEISGSVRYRFHDNWTFGYEAYRDIDAGLTRREELGFTFNDNCTVIELFYEKRRNDLGIANNSEGFGVRINLLTLGDFSDN